jgi:hypothetical protein
MKTQQIRLIDVYVLGPGMAYAATLIPSQYTWTRTLLGLSAIATIGYNARNYLLSRETHEHRRLATPPSSVANNCTCNNGMAGSAKNRAQTRAYDRANWGD